MGQLPQPALPVGGLEKTDGTGGENTPVLEEGFDLKLEAGLAADGFIVSLGGAFEHQARGIGGLPDGFEFIEPEQPGQGEGVAAVMFVGMRTDEAIMTRVTDDDLLDVGT